MLTVVTTTADDRWTERATAATVAAVPGTGAAEISAMTAARPAAGAPIRRILVPIIPLVLPASTWQTDAGTFRPLAGDYSGMRPIRT